MSSGKELTPAGLAVEHGWRLFLRLLVFFLSAVICAPAYAQSSAGKAVTACGHPQDPPLTWVEGGRIRGVAPAIVSKIFQTLGYQVKLEQIGNWKRCLREAELGNVDIVVAAFRIESRERFLNFSVIPVIEEPIVFFYNRLRPVTFESWADLSGKQIGMLLGDTFGAKADREIEQHMTVSRVSRGSQNFAKLADGRIDLMPLGLYGGTLQAQKLGYADIIDHLPKAFVSDYWYIGISKKSAVVEWMPYVNFQLEKMHQTGEIPLLMRQFSDAYIRSP